MALAGFLGNGSLWDGLNELMQLYRELDGAIAKFSEGTGVACTGGCRICCDTPATNIEATVFELLPQAIIACHEGRAEYWLDMIAHAQGEGDGEGEGGGEGRCVFLDHNLPQGGCSIYQCRPLLCRLFGFAAVLDKDARPLPLICRQMKKANPEVGRHAQQLIGDGVVEVPISAYYASRIAAINPTHGQSLLSINEAFRSAIQLAGLYLALAGGVNDGRPHPDGDNNSPQTPPFGRSA